MIKKLILAIIVGAFLSGCTQAKSVENKLSKQSDIKTEFEVNSFIQKEVEEKLKQEAELKIKSEEEAKAKAEQEAKAKEEAEVKAKQEQDAKAQHAVKPVVQSAQPSAPKPAQPAPVQVQTTQKNSTDSTAPKHPMEYKTEIENEILVLVNQERAKAGAKPMVMNETLRNMARYKSNDMLQYDYFDHTSPSVGGLSNLAKKFNYSYTALGENIWMSKAFSADFLRQNTTASKIMNGWMNSPGHKANILNPAFGKIGIGVTLSTDGLSHATQEFSN